LPFREILNNAGWLYVDGYFGNTGGSSLTIGDC